MDGHQAVGARPGGLTPPRRNRYYYAKMLDVLHFEMEQAYGRDMRWLSNRLTVGWGVLCGLEVTVEDGQICVTPGVAIDPLGREIVVPVRMCLDPRTLLDPCGAPLPEPDGSDSRFATLSVCYRECLTDHAPVVASDCQTKEPCAPGTVVETFRFVLEAGRPDPPTLGLCEKCGARLFPRDRDAGSVVGFEGEVVATVEVGGSPSAVAASSDGRVVVVVNEQRPVKVQLLDVETLGLTQVSRREIVAPVGGVSFAPDGGPALITSASGVAVIEVTGARPRLAKALLAQKAYGPCAAARGGRVLFAVDRQTGNVDVIDVRAERVRETIDAHGQARDVAVSADGLRLYVMEAGEGRVTERLIADLGRPHDLGGFARPDEGDGSLAVRRGPAGFEPLVARGADVRIVRPDGADERALEAVAARDAAFTSDGALLYLVNAFADPAGRRNELIAFDAGEVRELARVEIGQDPRSAAVVPGRLRAFVAHREPGLVSVIDGRVIREDPKPLDRRRILCECTSGPCPSPNGDCVPLAVLVRGPGGGPGRVETCAIRKRLYSNEMLLELIWCLAERLDECCERRPTSEPETPPGPGVPPRSATRQGGQA